MNRLALAFGVVALMVTTAMVRGQGDPSSSIMASTFRIQGTNQKGNFTGTCFLLSWPQKSSAGSPRIVLITAGHVLETASEDMVTIHMRQPDQDKPFEFRSRIRANGKPLYVKHPKADVAAMFLANLPVESTPPLLPVTSLATNQDLISNAVHIGTEVKVPGYPEGMSVEGAGTWPVLRTAHIATFPTLPKYAGLGNMILDSNLLAGNSGSPVYVLRPARPNPLIIGVYTGFFGNREWDLGYVVTSEMVRQTILLLAKQ